MSYSRTDIICNGSEDTFAVPFGHMLKADVLVYQRPSYLSPSGAVLKTVDVDYEWTSDGLIHLFATPANNSVVTLTRQSGLGAMRTTVQPGPVTASSLNAIATQLLYCTQEVRDTTLAEGDFPEYADLIGKDGGGTVQDFITSTETALDDIQGDLSDIIGTKNYGGQTTGSNEHWARMARYSANAAGTSDIIDIKWTSQFEGTGGNLAECRPFQFGAQYYHDAGLVNIAYGMLGYVRVGLDGDLDSAINSLRGCEFHIANEGNGDISTANVFQAGDVDFRGIGATTGTGIIDKIYGFRTNNLQGTGPDVGRVVSEVGCFKIDDVTAGAVLTAGVLSEMSSGTGKWFLLSTAGAKSAMFGAMRLGDNLEPTDQLEVKGYVKASPDGVYRTSGGYHELLGTGAGSFAAYITHKHASNPYGLRIQFDGGAPNNATNAFLWCEDTVGTKLKVLSTGNVLNLNNSYGGISDRRLKRNISDADLDAIVARFSLRQFKNFLMEDDPEDTPLRLGVIAQDELPHHPELVSASELNGQERYSFDYSNAGVEGDAVTMWLLQKVAALEARLAALEGEG